MDTENITNYVLSCHQIKLSKPQVLQSLHFHLIAVLDGQMTCSYTDTSISATCYQFTGTFPVYFDANNCTAIHLVLKPEFLLDFLKDSYFFTRNEITLSPEANTQLCQAIYHYASLKFSSKTTASFSKASILYEILQILKDNSPTTTIHSNPPTASKKLFLEINSYIEEYSSSHITQADTAKRFQITPQYLSRIMNLYTGKTFRKYLTELRTKKANDYLLYTSLSQKNISEKTGLPLDSPFFQTVSRKNQDVSNLNFNLGTVIHSPEPKLAPVPMIPTPKKEASTESYYLSFDMNKKKPLPMFWNKLINLGYASELGTLRIEQELKLLQEKIGFTYGRICRIKDLVYEHTVDNHKLYNYTAVFSLLDVVIRNGLYPFLELGNKVFMIQPTATNSLVLDEPLDSAQYYSELLNLLPDFLRACINRYGQECFDKWMFEVSYMFTDPEEITNFLFPNFVDYFQKIYSIIRSYSPHCKIGGPGFNNWESGDILHNYLSIFKHQKNIPDFFSAYLYSINKPEDNKYVICDDADIIKKRLQIFQAEVTKLYPGKKIWITEFNSNLSSRNYLNDLSYQATFLVKTFLDSLHSGIEAMGYYLLSDAPLRYSDTLEFLFGGWGLFTDTHIPKSSYYALRILSLLGNYLIKSSEKYILTENSNGSFQILINHYAHPAPKYLDENIKKEDILMENGQLFQSIPNRQYHFQFFHIPSGKYLIKEYHISEKMSNLFYEWEKIGFLNPTRQWELEDLYRLSTLSPKLSVQSVEENKPLSLECEQNTPEVCLYLIEQYSTF